MGESVCRVVCFSVCRGLGKKHTFAGGFWKNSTSETASNQGVTSHKLAAGLKKTYQYFPKTIWLVGLTQGRPP